MSAKNFRSVRPYKTFLGRDYRIGYNFIPDSQLVGKKVSIVIPCYNQAKWLPDAIESALNQTHKNIEVIVVNDGSTDNTSEIARQYPVKLVEKNNGGAASARNAGIKIADGFYILPLDGDDKISPLYIERTIGKGDIVGVMQQTFGDCEIATIPMENPQVKDFLQGNRINNCSLYKREIWEKIGGYDECELIKGYEDWDFWLRAVKAGYRVNVIKEKLFFYRKHGNSLIDRARGSHKEIIQYILSKR